MLQTDQRVQSVIETLGVLRMVKLFAWESKVFEQLKEKRDKELGYIRRNKLLDVILLNVQVLLPALSMMGTFGTYVSGTALRKVELMSYSICRR